MKTFAPKPEEEEIRESLNKPGLVSRLIDRIVCVK